jgi:hypothetical protein
MGKASARVGNRNIPDPMPTPVLMSPEKKPASTIIDISQ